MDKIPKICEESNVKILKINDEKIPNIYDEESNVKILKINDEKILKINDEKILKINDEELIKNMKDTLARNKEQYDKYEEFKKDLKELENVAYIKTYNEEVKKHITEVEEYLSLTFYTWYLKSVVNNNKSEIQDIFFTKAIKYASLSRDYRSCKKYIRNRIHSKSTSEIENYLEKTVESLAQMSGVYAENVLVIIKELNGLIKIKESIIEG